MPQVWFLIHENGAVGPDWGTFRSKWSSVFIHNFMHREAGMKRPQLGKYVYAFGGIFFGVVTLTWHQIKTLGDLSHPTALVILVGIAEIIGATAIQFKKSERVGALTLTAVFTVFSVYWISQVFNTSLGFVPWGNFGEQFSMMLGGVFIV